MRIVHFDICGPEGENACFYNLLGLVQYLEEEGDDPKLLTLWDNLVI